MAPTNHQDAVARAPPEPRLWAQVGPSRALALVRAAMLLLSCVCCSYEPSCTTMRLPGDGPTAFFVACRWSESDGQILGAIRLRINELGADRSGN
jgi:hypothetical protein